MTGWATAAITATLAKAAATPFRRRPGNALCRCQVTADCWRRALDRVDIAVDLIGFGGHVRTAKRPCAARHSLGRAKISAAASGQLSSERLRGPLRPAAPAARGRPGNTIDHR